MPGFIFKFKAVLDFKQRREDERKKELAELKEILRQEEELLASLEAKRLKVQQSIKENQSGLLNLEELNGYFIYLDSVRERINGQIEAIKGLIDGIENKRQELVEAAKERKIMEKLKENHYKKFISDLEKEQSKILDEIGTAGYNRKEKYAKN